MSWQDYVDVQLLGSGHVSQACIGGLDGNVWAKSVAFNVTPDEMKKIVSGYSDMDSLPQNGVRVSGEKFYFLSGDDKVLRAKKGKVGIHVVKTKQAVVLALYEDPIQPQQCALVVEKLGDYLISCGY